MLNPGSGRGPDGDAVPAAPNGRRGQRLARRPRPRRHRERGAGRRRARGRRARARPRVGARRRQRRGRGPAHHVDRAARAARDDLRRVRPAGPAHRDRGLDATCGSGAGSGRCCSATTTRSTSTSTCSTTRTRSFFPEPVTAPDGTESLAVLHRPMWDLGRDEAGAGGARARRASPMPGSRSGSATCRSRMCSRTSRALTLWGQHRFLAGPEYAFEELKIGGGPPPLRVPEGWLVLHHGVTGQCSTARSSSSAT